MTVSHNRGFNFHNCDFLIVANSYLTKCLISVSLQLCFCNCLTCYFSLIIATLYLPVVTLSHSVLYLTIVALIVIMIIYIYSCNIISHNTSYISQLGLCFSTLQCILTYISPLSYFKIRLNISQCDYISHLWLSF